MLVCDCPLTRLLSTALFAPFTRFLADPLGAEESQTCLIRHRRRRSLSAFIGVHQRPFVFFSRSEGAFPGELITAFGVPLPICMMSRWVSLAFSAIVLHGTMAAIDPATVNNPAQKDLADGAKGAALAPGRTNPGGMVWIGVSKEHYGIHGTPEPGKVGHASSHGCIRLTNWAAVELAGRVRPRTPDNLDE